MIQLVKITTLYLKLLFSDKLFIIAMIFFPLVFGSFYASSERINSSNYIYTAFVDYDNTALSNTLFNKISSHKQLKVTNTTLDKSKELLEKGYIEGIFILDKGFGDNLSGGKSTPSIRIVTHPSSFSAEFLSELISADVSIINSQILSTSLVSQKYSELGYNTSNLDEKISNYYNSLISETNPLLKVNYYMLNSSSPSPSTEVVINSSQHMTYGGLLMFIMFLLMFGSGWIIEEKENGMLKRLASTKNGLNYSFLATLLCLIVAGIVQTAFFSIIGIVFGLNIFNNILQYIIIFIFIICTSSIAMLLGILFKTLIKFQSFTPLFILLTSFAGGCIWDISLLSDRFEKISLLTPQGLTLNSLRSIASGIDISHWIWYPLLLLLVSIIVIILSYKLTTKKTSF